MRQRPSHVRIRKFQCAVPAEYAAVLCRVPHVLSLWQCSSHISPPDHGMHFTSRSRKKRLVGVGRVDLRTLARRAAAAAAFFLGESSHHLGTCSANQFPTYGMRLASLPRRYCPSFFHATTDDKVSVLEIALSRPDPHSLRYFTRPKFTRWA